MFADLAYLDLSGNHLTGEIPTEFQVLTKLQTLLLDSNDLVGVMPPQICSLREIAALDILTSDCSVGVEKVKCGCCTNCANMLPDIEEAPADTGITLNSRQLAIMQKLRQLSGDSVSAPDTPQHKATHWIMFEDTTMLTATSPNLYQRYILAVMYYTMSGDKCFELEPGIDECKWVAQAVGGKTWDRIACDLNKKVTYLKLDSCSMSGELPPELQALSYLTYLDLSDNYFSGIIPPSYQNLHDLGKYP